MRRTITSVVTRIYTTRGSRLYLREWRNHVGRTQQQVAERIELPDRQGVDKGTVSRWENYQQPKGRKPGPEEVAAYAHAIGRDPGEMWHPPPAGQVRPSIDKELASAPDETYSIVYNLVKQLTGRR